MAAVPVLTHSYWRQDATDKGRPPPPPLGRLSAATDFSSSCYNDHTDDEHDRRSVASEASTITPARFAASQAGAWWSHCRQYGFIPQGESESESESESEGESEREGGYSDSESDSDSDEGEWYTNYNLNRLKRDEENQIRLETLLGPARRLSATWSHIGRYAPYAVPPLIILGSMAFGSSIVVVGIKLQWFQVTSPALLSCQ